MIIPPKAREKVVKRHSNGMNAVALYYLNRKLVGHRSWNMRGNIVVEYSIQDNVKNGPFRTYHNNGALSWRTQFVKGKEHGVSRQYDETGIQIGTYRMTHGTGTDLWYTAARELSEERHVKDGKWNGFERWWKSPNSIWRETHFKNNREHGIQRAWNDHGRLRRGYPQYFIDGLRVTKRRYQRACTKDPSLPVYRKDDDDPKRKPPELQRPANKRAAGRPLPTHS